MEKRAFKERMRKLRKAANKKAQIKADLKKADESFDRDDMGHIIVKFA